MEWQKKKKGTFSAFFFLMLEFCPKLQNPFERVVFDRVGHKKYSNFLRQTDCVYAAFLPNEGRMPPANTRRVKVSRSSA